MLVTGSLDVIANEWTEGIFANLWRKANKDKKHFTWLVLDGPVDAIWIENMNTVMDDNKILTLANNDRIPMLRPNVTLHFEVEDLRNASPATVSRAGIIFVSLSDLGWMPMVQSWLATRKANEAEVLRALFVRVIEPLLDFMAANCKPRMQCSPVSLLSSTIALLEALVIEFSKVYAQQSERTSVLGLLRDAARTERARSSSVCLCFGRFRLDRLSTRRAIEAAVRMSARVGAL